MRGRLLRSEAQNHVMNEETDSRRRVLVADDHPIVREGMVAIVESTHDLTCVTQADGVEAAVEKWAEHRPDVGLFDLRMADGDAVSAITRIRKDFPDARVLVISSYDTDEEVYRVIKSGAKGYLLKDDKPEVILSAIRMVLQGQTYLAPHLATKLASRVSEDSLSDREVEILSLVAAGRNNNKIASELNITASTIKFHLNNIYAKLAVESRTAAVATAVKRGIISI